jgi:lysozyme family protein
MKANREQWLEDLFQHEGGYVDHPEDRGGPTNFGVTQATLASWRRQPVTAEDVKALDIDEAQAIMSARYWNVVQGDRLPPGVDIAVADFAVNSGNTRAVKILQDALGVEPDGHVGPQTMAACLEIEPSHLIGLLHDARLRFLRSLPTWQTFGKGWTTRCRQVTADALALASQQPAPKPARVEQRGINIEAAAAIVAGAAAALPAAKEAYDQAVTGAAPLEVIAPWLPVVLGVVAAACAVLLALRARKLIG